MQWMECPGILCHRRSDLPTVTETPVYQWKRLKACSVVIVFESALQRSIAEFEHSEADGIFTPNVLYQIFGSRTSVGVDFVLQIHTFMCTPTSLQALTRLVVSVSKYVHVQMTSMNDEELTGTVCLSTAIRMKVEYV